MALGEKSEAVLDVLSIFRPPEKRRGKEGMKKRIVFLYGKEGGEILK